MLGARTSNQNSAVQGLSLVGFLTALLLKGVGLEALWVHVLALIGFAVILLTISTKRFRNQLS